MPTEHSHVMGGSTAMQRIHCPGSYQLEQKAPEKESSEYADEGSMLHAAMELLIADDPQDDETLDQVMNELVGQNMGYEGHEITEEHLDEKLYPAFNAWVRIKDRWGLHDWNIEQKLSLGTVIEGAFGTSDLIGVDKHHDLHVLDWKFGDGVPVEVEGNYGMGFYAAGVFYDPSPEMEEFLAGVRKNCHVHFHIVQPRRGFPDDNPWQHWRTSEQWVEDFLDRAVEAVKLALSDNPPCKAGSWCRWCAGKPACGLHQTMASDALTAKPSGSLTAIELAKWYDIALQLEPWIKEIKTLVKTEMEGGVPVPGFKLVKGRSTRYWAEEQEVEQILRKSKVPVAKIFKKTLISPAQAEKQVPKLFAKKLKNHVNFKKANLAVAPDSDKRPAVTSGMEMLANALPDKAPEPTNDRGLGPGVISGN